MYFISHCFIKDWKIGLVKAVPLSESSCSSEQCVEKSCLSFLISSEEIESTIWTSRHFEWASFKRKKRLPKSSPTLSTSTLVQGCQGNFQIVKALW